MFRQGLLYFVHNMTCTCQNTNRILFSSHLKGKNNELIQLEEKKVAGIRVGTRNNDFEAYQGGAAKDHAEIHIYISVN